MNSCMGAVQLACPSGQAGQGEGPRTVAGGSDIIFIIPG